ncbi:MAG: protein kinase [Planctomycetia bacterium]|nr:protein kinase [Planctomycetia bacterium]
MLIGQQIGPFEIEKELGCGAMGTVYRAKFHRSADKIIPVALKVVALGLVGNESAMARFEREANILKQLRHPHIVRLIAHGKINKQNPYIAMEFIDGEALDRALARRGKLSWEEVVVYGKQLCEALQYAHDKGIIHRDLKPSNLMIDRDGLLKLTDFGIAKDTDVTALTGANSTIGTAAYMSPEQCKGDRNLSNKSDLYSLGICFFELLSGRKPFTADTTVEMFLKHVNEKPPRIGKLVNELPLKFEALILQLLEKDKEDRPIDAAWVARMLGEIEEDAYARKSAGLVAAEVRTAKPTNLGGERMDEADKEAARALRGKKKKVKKKPSVPLMQRTWMKAVGFSAILLALAVIAFFMLKPTSPEKMFAAIEKAETPEERLKAATEFLEEYGDKGGEMVDKAAVVYREGIVRDREKQLANRFKNNISKPGDSDDPEAYTAAWQAMELERSGDWEAAALQWAKVKARFPDEAKLPYTLKEDLLTKARWGWLADKRITDLKTARGEYTRLEKKIEENRRNEISVKPDPTNPEWLAMRVIRLTKFGDMDRAASACDTLRTLTETDPDKKTWYLLAAYLRTNITKGPPDAAEQRRRRIDARLAAAEKTALTALNNPNLIGAMRRSVRNDCREVIELYEDDPDVEVKKLVGRAKTIAESVSKG